MNPMLVSHYSRNNRRRTCSEPYVFIQPKLDGWRAVVNTKTGVIYSREGNVLNLPHVSADIIGNDYPEWLDGELYCHGFRLDQIASMIRKGDVRIKFNCFDAIVGGIFSDRIEAVYRIRETENVRIVATRKITPARICVIYRRYLNSGFEGAIVRLDREYENRRSKNILKIKPGYN